MSFDLSEYVDVAERIKLFRDKHPEGSLQSEVKVYLSSTETPYGVLCQAWAYRTPDDARPGVGHSWLAVPGTTPYTRGSEVENAETSAWGRAIVAALAADTKKVASADEVRSKHEGSAPAANAAAGRGAAAPAGDGHLPPTGPAGATSFQPPEPRAAEGTAMEWRWPFGKNKGLTLAETERGYLDWFLSNSDKEDIKQRVREFLNVAALEETFAGATDVDGDVPF